MMMTTVELSAPHNWCDRRCERCPLASTCPVPAAAARDLDEILAEALALAEAAARAEGLDVDAPIELPPPSIERVVLEDVTHAWVAAVMELEPHVRDLPWRLMFVAGKVARVAGMADDPDPDVWAMDVIMNLLVLEHVLDSIAGDVARASIPPGPRARFHERDATLRALLAPHLATITATDRAALAALATTGRAPSPFVTTTATALTTTTMTSAST